MTVVGSSIPAFFKEIINQGILASDIPILGLDVLEADLEGLDTTSLVGHLNCWAYLQNVESEANTEIKSNWASFVKSNGLPYKSDVMIDPMVSAYDGVHMWAKAVEKAGLGDFNFHDLRHCAINNLRLAWNDHFLIKQASGHKTDVAFRRYNLVTEDEMKGMKLKRNRNERLLKKILAKLLTTKIGV